jgi:lipopolysaccharide cholinephosphotransferase
MKRIKSVQEIKDIEFEVMKYVNETSKKLGIQCFLSGGTLLGAIRHKGFIPWDDDVDLMLKRQDYHRLIDAINRDTRSPYKALTYRTDSQYYYPFAKVVDTRTGISENVRMPISTVGIGVDIFPIDGLPKSEVKQKRHFSIIGFLRKYYEYVYKINSDTRPMNKAHEWMYRTFLRTLSRLINSIAVRHSFDGSSLVAVSVWGYGLKERIARSRMNRAVTVEFEKEEFFAPLGYDNYLRNLYGNYMQLPPKAKQHAGHNVTAWYREGAR